VLNQTGREKDSQELRSRIKWLTIVRVIMVTFIMLSVIFIRRVGDTPLEHTSLIALFYTIGAIYAASAAYGLAFRFSDKLFTQASVQFSLDPFFITAIIYVTGGVNSVFTFLYIFSIFGASIILERKWAMIVASLSGILYGTLVDLQFYEIIHPFQLVTRPLARYDASGVFFIILSNFAAFYVVAFLGSHLQGQLDRARLKLKQQSKDMMELEALNDRIVESIGSGLITLDNAGRIVSMNTAAQKILELSYSQVFQEPLTSVIPEMMGGARSDSEEGVKSFKTPRGEITISTKKGERLCLGFSISTLTSVEGMEIGNIMIFQDITKIKEMQEEVKKLERLAMMGTLAAGMAHEIKNPLGAMSGAFQMLRKEDPGSPIANRLVSIIEREMSRLKDLLNEFLWLSKPVRETGESAMVALEPIVADTITLIQSKLKLDGQVSFERNIPENFHVYVNESHFRQVVWNLMLNALEAMDNRGRISVSAEQVFMDKEKGTGESYSKISFTDSGCGIPENIRGRITEPFFTTKDAGTGLGLAVVQQIVNTHQGRMDVTSQDGQGTTFSVYLPFRGAVTTADAAH